MTTKQKMRAWGIRLAVAVVVAFIAWKWGMPLYARYFSPKKVEAAIPTAGVAQGKFVVSFRKIGDLQAEKSVRVNSETNGKIITLAKAGEIANKGDLIAELDTSDLEREIRNRQLSGKNEMANVERAKVELAILADADKTEVEQAQRQLDFDKIQLTGVAQKEIDLAQNELEIAQNDLVKKQRLVDKKLLPGSEARLAESTVRSRNSSLLSAKAMYESKRMTVEKSTALLDLQVRQCQAKEKQKEADIANAEFRVSMAKRELEDIQRRISGSTIKAPASGMIVLGTTRDANGARQPFKEGDMVRRRETVCELPDLATIQVVVQLGEADVPRVSIGMPCLIRLDAIPGKLFHGSVRDIAKLASVNSDRRGPVSDKKHIDVKVSLKEVGVKALKPGLSAEVEFICKTMDKAVHVPMESVIEQDGGTFVYVKAGKGWERRQVEVGMRSEDDVAILRGLRKGETIALRDPMRPPDQQEIGDEPSTDAGGQ